jgi:hypothetical protein
LGGGGGWPILFMRNTTNGYGGFLQDVFLDLLDKL